MHFQIEFEPNGDMYVFRTGLIVRPGDWAWVPGIGDDNPVKTLIVGTRQIAAERVGHKFGMGRIYVRDPDTYELTYEIERAHHVMAVPFTAEKSEHGVVINHPGFDHKLVYSFKARRLYHCEPGEDPQHTLLRMWAGDFFDKVDQL